MKFLEEDFAEPQIGVSSETLQRSLEIQRDLFHSQVDQFQRIVVKQCKLTGVNPLSQEMVSVFFFFFGFFNSCFCLVHKKEYKMRKFL